MIDHSKLKALAEGCRDEVIRSHGWAGMIEDADLLHRDEQFLKECSPEAVLALIAENEGLRKNAERYLVLRQADVDTIHNGGLFAGLTPDNIVINGSDLDERVDAVLALCKVTP